MVGVSVGLFGLFMGPLSVGLSVGLFMGLSLGLSVGRSVGLLVATVVVVVVKGTLMFMSVLMDMIWVNSTKSSGSVGSIEGGLPATLLPLPALENI